MHVASVRHFRGWIVARYITLKWSIAWVVCVWLAGLAHAEPRIWVLLWFDTEDYILPASDDAALRLAQWLTERGIPATFKVVGEKARTLERRGRRDVIDALKKHDIGYHSNYHSVHPTPAMYLADMGWDDGVAEFVRREGPGYEDVRRIFGQAPSCYGQPGGSWAPQAYGALARWGVPVYLDAGSHVGLEGQPHYYCGLLTLYHLRHTLRTGLDNDREVEAAEERFAKARRDLLASGGGVVSIYYHPCEFVHAQFWDGVNFRRGANPPRELWKLPPMKTGSAQQQAWRNFERYIQFIARFPEVRFVTARQAARLFADPAPERVYTGEDLRALLSRVTSDITYGQLGEVYLSPAEMFLLATEYLRGRFEGREEAIRLTLAPLGPVSAGSGDERGFAVDRSQFERTVADVADYVRQHRRLPATVWFGSRAATPEAYFAAVARVSTDWLGGPPPPDTIQIVPARLQLARYVAQDAPGLWGWIIFPEGFRAPRLMELARYQAWTLKPARPRALPDLH